MNVRLNSQAWYGTSLFVVLGFLAGIYFSNQAQVFFAVIMEGRAPSFPVAISLIVLHFDLAVLLVGLALAWVVVDRPWWIAVLVGLLLLVYHAYWTHHHLDGHWRWWYLLRILLLPVFVFAGMWLGRLCKRGGASKKVLGFVGCAVLGSASLAYLIHLGRQIATA
ncbi:MAG: hypothetical protein GXP09_02535 [Gammaproteobacteria bacterium]|nr:hypothetical protein [Gammaproteobacteria bacterium]